MGAADLLSASIWWRPTAWWCLSAGLMLRSRRSSMASTGGGAVAGRVNEARGGSQTCIADAQDPDQGPSPAVGGFSC